MEKIYDLYLVFSSWELYYLLPLSWVKFVSDDKSAEEELPVLDFELLANGQSGRAENRYLIMLEYQGEKLGLLVENVREVREIPEEQFLVLDDRIINKKNRYLSAVVPMKTEEGGEVLAYLLNPEFLYEAAAGSL